MLQTSINEQLAMYSNPMTHFIFWKVNIFKNLPKFSDCYKDMIRIRNNLFGYIDHYINEHLKQLDEQIELSYDSKDFIEAYLREIHSNRKENQFFS